MIEYRFEVGDLATTSFAYSPLQEAVFSLRSLHDPSRYPHHRPWLRRLGPRLAALDSELLTALTAPWLWVPDFLTPRPERARPVFADELEQVRRTPPHVVVADFRAVYRSGDPLPPVVARGLDEPEAFLARIADTLDAYWQTCLAADWWPRAQSVLEADLAHRARVLAEQGAGALFGGLDTRLTWTGELLRMCRTGAMRAWAEADIRIAGRGLVLMPSLFARGALTVIDVSRPPVLTYPARGAATLSETPPPVTDQALVRLLGRPRARLLLLLAEPASTTELAHRLDVTPGAVSQHLAVLYDAGLLSRTRTGRIVRYARTRLGDDLCQ
ncbi:helix-turn-helix domain-containing protein [Streptomyces viridochromogenes]|uniref:Putative ArsR family transcriptional regulator n=1 Tax=Streptomyces viridochromogenes Tue57 TaxID=1160705 RepID=L8PIV6_STRVR|nr:helix-turn-helix domain-containing protein [Streptomyces viridochromogenes]ELS57476.1 putative ArsR family transcriptional regulator [Streptomyces viridochromogenes Tue57]